MKNNSSKLVLNLCLSSVFLALCMVLPMITGGIPKIGNALCPMHIPVFLCAFVCGWQYAAVVGFVAPLLRFFIFSMPPIYPIGAAMAFELLAYGLICGLAYKLFPKKNIYIYPSLIISMIGGRLVWGVVRYIMAGLGGSEFNMSMFLAGAFTQAVPALILHIVLIPVIVIALKKAKLIK